MSNGYQIIVLKKLLTIVLFSVNVVGLWSFKFVACKRRIKYSPLKAIYSISMLSIGLCAYTFIGKASFFDHKQFFGSFTLRLALVTYAYSVLVSFAIAHLQQHWLARTIEMTYIKCVDIVATMDESFWKVDFSRYIIELMLKTIVYDIINGIISFNNMRNSSVLISTRPYLAIILMVPFIVGRFHVNIFYGVILAINVYMQKLNGYLIDIVTKAAYINATNSPRHKCFRMDRYCNFSDEIDKLSALYVKLVEATKLLNSIFSLTITFWNTTTFLICTVQFLYQFISIMELSQERKESTMTRHIFGNFIIFLLAFDLLTTTNACQRIVNSVSQVLGLVLVNWFIVFI